MDVLPFFELQLWVQGGTNMIMTIYINNFDVTIMFYMHRSLVPSVADQLCCTSIYFNMFMLYV
jgi:hypothetical protein